MYKVDSSYPFAKFVNQSVLYLQYTSPAALANQIQVGYPGDPLAGTIIQGSTLAWNAATQTQCLIDVWYSASGTVRPDDYDAVLSVNIGPNLMWNWSYVEWAAAGIIKL